MIVVEGILANNVLQHCSSLFIVVSSSLFCWTLLVGVMRNSKESF